MLPQPNVLPNGYNQYGLQIAGHKPTDVGKESLGVVEDSGTGHLLKPLQSKGRGEVEKAFYEEVKAEHPTLAGFLPKYYGTKRVAVNDKEVEFLVLENLTSPFSHPCILDIKLGYQTWEPSASAEKVSREESKYQWGKELGWRVLGLKVYDSESGKYINRGKSFGRTLPPKDVPKMMELFFGQTKRSAETMAALESRLRKIETWLFEPIGWDDGALNVSTPENRDRLFPPELFLNLFIHPPNYNAGVKAQAMFDEKMRVKMTGDESVPVKVDVRMIDFAHIGREPRTDDNYLHGLSSFIQYLNAYHTLLNNPTH